MIRDERVDRIMTTDVRSISVDATLDEARSMMNRCKVSRLPVLSGARLVGILSATDLVRSDDAADVQPRIPDLMQVHPRTLRVSDTIRTAASVLLECAIHALPVVDADQNLLGIVSATDLVRNLLDHMPDARPAAKVDAVADVRAEPVPMLSAERYELALKAAYQAYSSEADSEHVAHALLYADRRLQLLSTVSDAARRFLNSGQDAYGHGHLQKAIDALADFEEQAGSISRMPAGRA